MDEQQSVSHPPFDLTNIMKELSDIKREMAVNTTETANIKSTVGEIKSDIKEIKNDFVSRREFSEKVRDLNKEMAPIKKIVYGMLITIGLSVLYAILSTVIINGKPIA